MRIDRAVRATGCCGGAGWMDANVAFMQSGGYTGIGARVPTVKVLVDVLHAVCASFLPSICLSAGGKSVHWVLSAMTVAGKSASARLIRQSLAVCTAGASD